MQTSTITFQLLDGSSSWNPSDDLQWFREKHANWLALQQGGDDDVAYCLHPEHFNASLDLFKLDAKSREAERDLATICDRSGAIGISGDRFIKYSLLQPLLVWPSNLHLNDFIELGWDETQIASLKSLSNPTSTINHRLRAAAGRLVSMPTFKAAREKIRDAWLSLPPSKRPLLPIARSSLFPASHRLDLRPPTSALGEFMGKFDQFCFEWHLLGMATWDLPDVRRPIMVPGLASDGELRRGDLTVTIPWHFHVLAEDGLGPVLEAEHRHQASELGITDGASWETYAHLLGVHYWEIALCNRYSKAQRLAKFKTKMEAVLGKILDLKVSRVQRLRLWLRALQAGKIKSLQGKR
jgi:hypothetical protein